MGLLTTLWQAFVTNRQPGASSRSSSTVGSIQEPRWSACRICQATGMAQLR